MEFGCKMFETNPEKDNFAAFCGPNRAVTTAHTIFDDTMVRYKYAYSFDLGSTTRYPESRSDILIRGGITLMHKIKCLNLRFDPGVYIVVDVPTLSFEMCNDLSSVQHIAYPLRKSRGCIILLEVGSLFTFNRPYWSYSINISLVVHDMQFYWKIPTQANCDIADAFIHGDFSFVATIEGLLNLVTIRVTISDLKAFVTRFNRKRIWWTPLLFVVVLSSETSFIQYVSDQNTFPYDMRNELFSLFLDVTVSYSCAIIESVDDDLKVVQLCAHSLFVEKSRIRKAYHIVEIGFVRESLVTEIDKPPGYNTTTLLQRDVVDDREISTKKWEPALFCGCWIELANLLAILKLVLVNFPDSRDSTTFPVKYVVSSCTLHVNRYLIAKYAKDSCKQVATQLIYLGEKYFAAEEILFMGLIGMKEIQCQATKVAGATVDFNVMQVITKPIAAAIAYGLDTNVSKLP
ncbi:hypothetical protein A4A49_25782 [Nicotiana attenuata]|uniref:Uncharacterized protein n=1 Tax=Nicotiana attenuata TaxID=49451 RepID=A0A314KV47_NICAT|nr:hypothetical protein A4A49_25782 [Nicotiana attenuata]